MLFTEAGNGLGPTIILLHGGGLGEWSLVPLIEQFKDKFRVIGVTIDGHGKDSQTTFESIEISAMKMIDYIDAHCQGRVFAMGGLSIGGQIVTEILSQRATITQYAILESALVVPMERMTKVMLPAYHLLYGLIKKPWFAKLQADALCLPDDMFDDYFKDSKAMSKESLMNITLSNGTYKLKDEIRQSKAKVLIIVGEKEIGIIRKSAEKLHESLEESHVFVAKGMKHGEMSLRWGEGYARLCFEYLWG